MTATHILKIEGVYIMSGTLDEITDYIKDHATDKMVYISRI